MWKNEAGNVAEADLEHKELEVELTWNLTGATNRVKTFMTRDKWEK